MPDVGAGEHESPDREAGYFSELYPEGRLESIAATDVPEKVMERFEQKSQNFINHADYRAGNFEKYYIITHTNGDSTYVAEQTKTYRPDGDTERLTYFVDTRDGQGIGHAELRNNISNVSPYFKNKPFIGYSMTEEEFRRQGLGKRRLVQIAAYSEAHYRLPLYSDTLNSEANIWDALVSQGLARKFNEGKKPRYMFIERFGSEN